MARKRSKKIQKKKIQVLPNPELVRFPIVDECKGCEKIYTDLDVCMVYEDPAKVQRRGCAFNYVMTAEEIKKMNPLKASKKKHRRR